MKTGKYSKFVVAIIGAAQTATTTFTGAPHWVTVMLNTIVAVGVYLVPNQQ